MKQYVLIGMMLITPFVHAKKHKKSKPATQVVQTPEQRWENFKSHTVSIILQPKKPPFPGWCCEEKARKIMDTVKEVGMSMAKDESMTTVEVGVFGGSSLFAFLRAHEFIGKGKVYGIDPWTVEACQVGYSEGNENYEWWTKHSHLQTILANLKKNLKTYDVAHRCTLMEMTSEAAVSQFEDGSVDILHVDGNHSEDMAYLDATLWLPKVKPGGYIWFDDINWKTTAKAVSFIKEYCDLDLDRSVGHDCYLFKKRAY